MQSISRGLIAGLIGTAALSMMMIGKSMLGLMPELDVIRMLSGMLSAPPAVGWAAHFAIGALWGVFFGIVYDALPGDNGLVKGIVFGMLAWLAMMVLVMPMAGAGLFGLGLGIMAPIMTAMLHALFGAVMGLAYDKLQSAPAASAASYG